MNTCTICNSYKKNIIYYTRSIYNSTNYSLYVHCSFNSGKHEEKILMGFKN